MGLCFGCLERGHMVNSCRRRRHCGRCNGRHPTALHRTPIPPTNTASEAAGIEANNSNERRSEYLNSTMYHISNDTNTSNGRPKISRIEQPKTTVNHISSDRSFIYGAKLNVVPVLAVCDDKFVYTNAFLDSGLYSFVLLSFAPEEIELASV